MYQAIFEKLS